MKTMDALVLEKKRELSLRDFPIEREERVGPHDVRVKLHTVGICGSDVHYYTDGKIGPFVVNAPMILGHEASGTVTEVGRGSPPSNLVTGSAWSPAFLIPTAVRRGWECTTSTRRSASGRRRRCTA